MIPIRIHLNTFEENRSYAGFLMEEEGRITLSYEDEEGGRVEVTYVEDRLVIQRKSGAMVFNPLGMEEFFFNTPHGELGFRLVTHRLEGHEGLLESDYSLFDETGQLVHRNNLTLTYTKE